ncbi:hypothetical protein [Kitasatospora aureofaciens]|uniref:hypothetical protein n=1 Tax=Kitasatospora aureofaciens TaxID=1894 RepID=UPI00052749AA|nr:hypothetical protein [Kitasatospora aureofaciens]
MDSTDRERTRAERLYSSAREYRIGSRVTLDGSPSSRFTLVALELGRGRVFPLYVDDDCVSGKNTQFGVLDRDEAEHVVPAPDDEEKARAAQAWAASAREDFTHYGQQRVLFDTPASAEQVWRFLQFCEADREWRIAERAQRQAASQRAEAIAQIVWGNSNQSSTARLLGLNQSTVSRAVASVTSDAP